MYDRRWRWRLASMQPDQRFSPPRCGQLPFDRPLRRVVRDMLLPRTLEGAILVSNSPGIWGMSV
jgi:hypothetical protein